MAKNISAAHDGGSTTVINSSLYGMLKEAEESGRVRKVYGTTDSSEGILRERLLDLVQFPKEKLQLLLQTPATATGPSRYALKQEDYEAMVNAFRKHEIKHVLLDSGNGTMGTCGKIYGMCKDAEICVVGAPRVINDDIATTDYTPEFDNTVRYIAETTAKVRVDVRTLPIHVCVVEVMGWDVGWIMTASALAKKKPGNAPHPVYLSERPFNGEEFLEDVKRLYEKKGSVVVVTNEGLKNGDDEPIVPPIFKTERTIYYGGVSPYLTSLAIQKLKVKTRSEKLDVCGRASIALQSPMSREGAVLAGREALKAAVNGESGVTVSFIRNEAENGSCRMRMELVPTEEVMIYGQIIPEEYINERGGDMTDAFVKWCKPLINGEPKDITGFREYYEGKEEGSK